MFLEYPGSGGLKGKEERWEPTSHHLGVNQLGPGFHL